MNVDFHFSLLQLLEIKILAIHEIINWLVRCPKWLFDKFNILEFERGAEWGCQRHGFPGYSKFNLLAQFISTQMCIWDMILEIAPKSNKKGPNAPARFISTRMYIWEMIFDIAIKAQICRPDLFPRRCISERWFLKSPQNPTKKAQIRRPDLFPRGCIS